MKKCAVWQSENFRQRKKEGGEKENVAGRRSSMTFLRRRVDLARRTKNRGDQYCVVLRKRKGKGKRGGEGGVAGSSQPGDPFSISSIGTTVSGVVLGSHSPVAATGGKGRRKGEERKKQRPLTAAGSRFPRTACWCAHMPARAVDPRKKTCEEEKKKKKEGKEGQQTVQ